MLENSIPNTLIEAADAIACGQISAQELTEHCIQRAEEMQPKLNCFISLKAEKALVEAKELDEKQAKGETLGPLHGVPMAHKDMYYRAGEVSTCGSKIRKNFVPNYSATVIDRLSQSGGVHLGNLNMAEFAFGPTGHNVHWGDCRNPWNTDYVTGGSSSGTGSAVGARIAYAGLGSDTGGSIRLPAGICGLTGIKPTQTRVSRYGVMGLSFSLDNVGPLARTARDCARVLKVIAGADPKDASASKEPVEDYEACAQHADLKGLKIAVPTNYYYDHVQGDVEDLLNDSLRVFESLGAHIVETHVPDHENLSDLANVVMGSEAATLHGAWLRDCPGDYSEQVLARIQPGLSYLSTRYLQALQIRPEITRRFVDQVLGDCDVFHAPVLPIPTPTIEETDIKASQGFRDLLGLMTYCTRPINFLGLPAISIPAGFTENGLPTSFQLVGRPFDEGQLFKFAAAFQDNTDWHKQSPIL